MTIAATTFDALTSPEALAPVLTQAGIWLLAGAAGILFYAYALNRAVFEGRGRVNSGGFQGWDALTAALLVGFFLFAVAHGGNGGDSDAPETVPRAADVIAGMIMVAVIFLLLIAGILTTMHLRHVSWRETFGLTRLGLPAVVGWAVLLLFLAYPLISISAVLSELLLAAGGNNDNSTQELVNFFAHSNSGSAKWAVAVSAMLVAPMQEEFLFRGYIYGVVRRYGGVTLGVLVNSTLFALIHMHLPSFVPLFVLAVCLSLAYEWTGSIWVSMCMHAMFNSITVLNLLLGHDS